jgi:hypothetical protein
VTLALPASIVVSQIGLAERRETINVLSDLDPRERALARTLLADIPADARIAIADFAADVRRRAREQAVAEAEQRSSDARPWRYAITLMDEAEVAEFRRLVESGEDPDRAAERALDFTPPLRANGKAEPDDELDEAPPRRRGSIRRRPIRGDGGAQRADGGKVAPEPAQAATPARSGTAGRRGAFLGPRVFGPHTDDRPYGQSIDFDHSAKSFPPPWLLDPEPDAEPDPDDGDDEDVDIEARASA